MSQERIKPSHKFRGSPQIPGDKSISHRGLIFGALAEGRSEVLDILQSEDVQSTARCLRDLGVKITEVGQSTFIEGVGGNFQKPTQTLDCGNSGTTIRLLMGVLASKNIEATMSGDASLNKRPMNRVATPLLKMGAHFSLTNDNYAPLTVKGTKLKGTAIELKVASAQIKSAIILAALSADGDTKITGEILSRDHTERMLPHYGAKIQVSDKEINVPGNQKLKAAKLQVPGDPSTAAFWMAAASLIPGSELQLNKILLNPTRSGFIKVLQRMGVSVQLKEEIKSPEEVGSIQVKAAALNAFHITKDEIPSLIDEIPILAVLASQAQGVSLVEGAEELRVKESDRLEAIAVNLRAMGVEIELRQDGFRIEGPQKLKAASIKTFHDHRIAMAFSVAGLVAEGETLINDSECVSISYPDFYKHLNMLTEGR